MCFACSWPQVDPPLDSAEPTATIAEGEEEEGEEEKDQRMETSRTAAAAAAGAAAPSRSSSELEPYSPLEGDASSSASSSAAPSRAASSASAAAPSAGSGASPSSVLVPLDGLSPLQMAHPLVNKILGVLYGGALGDAHGLATEFLDRASVAHLYGAAYDPATGAGAIPFPHTKKTRHSSRWDAGDWTDDTDQLLLIMETILESFAGASKFATDSTPSPELFAAKLHQWVRRGFPELGDQGGMGLGALTAQVVSHKHFLSSPHKAAEAVWVAGGRKAAANGGVMRTAITGLFDYMHPERVVANTKAMCAVTHADPRCTASCVLIALLISRILQGAAIESAAQTEALVDSCVAQTIASVPALAELGHEAAFREYIGLSRSLSDLKLDDPPAIGYTLKCMGSGLYGLRSAENFATTITRLTREAGDADTNGAVCGAMLGARLGYDGLPAEWLQAMPNKKWMDKKVVALIKLMFERYERENKAGAGAGAAAASSSSSAAAAAPSK